MIAQIKVYTDYVDTHGIPTTIPLQYDPEEIEESSNEPVYQPAPTCGQCEHFYQGKIGRAKGTPWGIVHYWMLSVATLINLAGSTKKIAPSR